MSVGITGMERKHRKDSMERRHEVDVYDYEKMTDEDGDMHI